MGAEKKTETIKFFDTTKGFWFIKQDDRQRDLFVHLQSLKENFKPQEGDKVDYLIVEGKKGPCAEDVQKI